MFLVEPPPFELSKSCGDGYGNSRSNDGTKKSDQTTQGDMTPVGLPFAIVGRLIAACQSVRSGKSPVHSQDMFGELLEWIAFETAARLTRRPTTARRRASAKSQPASSHGHITKNDRRLGVRSGLFPLTPS